MAKILTLFLLFPSFAWAQCTITWPPRPGSEMVTQYNLYADSVGNPNAQPVAQLTTTAIRMSLIPLDETVPHELEVSATNVSGEGPRSAPFQYTPPIPVPGQVGAPTVSGC